ncbi:MAG: TIR domain-containing protein [Oscillospiraceae bacterium]|jgi:hypothetical protein|nr:TIR domain-containing protein [Oscillospiraceae bacterium]
MNLFVIHSFSDAKKVAKMLSKISNACEDVSILTLENDRRYWKARSKSLIKKSDFVLVVIGSRTSLSSNVAWEIGIAKKLKRNIFAIRLSEGNAIPASLRSKDKFSGREKNDYKEMTIDTMICEIKEYIPKRLFPFGFDQEKSCVLLEQYKLMLGTSEALVLRRQQQNEKFIALSSIIISAIGGVLALEKIVFVVIGFLLGFVGTFICFTWMKTIDAYGQLNEAKFKVINEMELKLAASVFEAEWAVLDHKKKYRSFTQREKAIPKLFIIAYGLVLVVAVFFIIIKRI